MSLHALTAVIAEDEPVLLAQLRDMLGLVWPELDIKACAENGLLALRALEEHTPDVLFLDIQMPGITGVEVARRASGMQHVIFVTAYDEHAVSAFEAGAVDYIMKPLGLERLALACTRVKARVASAPPTLDRLLDVLARRMTQTTQHLRWINASLGDEVRLITIDEVCYFQSDTKYTRVVTREGESLIRKSLKELLNELDPSQFWQIHRSTIVNAQAIAGLSRDLSGRYIVKLKTRSETLPVSQQFAQRFRQM